MLTGGPTLGTDFGEYFGNLYTAEPPAPPEPPLNCAVFTNSSNVPVRIESVSVTPPPIEAVPDCDPGGDASGIPSCAPGLVLPPDDASGCRLGVRLPLGTDLGRNYLAENTWVLSAECISADGDPTVDVCAVAGVQERNPAPTNPVSVRLDYVIKIRYCGATDYANAPGEAPGRGGPPDNGCV